MTESTTSDRDMKDQACAPEEAAPQAQADEVEALRREVAECRAKADEYLDSYRRSVADFSNYRKRQEREREQQQLRLSMDVLRKLLPAVDDLHLALKNMPPEAAGAAWGEGVALIAHKLDAILADFGATPIEALGKPFDPNYHSAMLKGESDQYPAGTVMEELQRGYMLAGQVLRPTSVKVSTGPSSS